MSCSLQFQSIVDLFLTSEVTLIAGFLMLSSSIVLLSEIRAMRARQTSQRVSITVFAKGCTQLGLQKLQQSWMRFLGLLPPLKNMLKISMFCERQLKSLARNLQSKLWTKHLAIFGFSVSESFYSNLFTMAKQEACRTCSKKFPHPLTPSVQCSSSLDSCQNEVNHATISIKISWFASTFKRPSRSLNPEILLMAFLALKNIY